MEVYQLIIAGGIRFPRSFSKLCMDLVARLLVADQVRWGKQRAAAHVHAVALSCTCAH